MSWDKLDTDGDMYGVLDALQDTPQLLALFHSEDEAEKWAKAQEEDGFPEWCVVLIRGVTGYAWNHYIADGHPVPPRGV